MYDTEPKLRISKYSYHLLNYRGLNWKIKPIFKYRLYHVYSSILKMSLQRVYRWKETGHISTIPNTAYPNNIAVYPNGNIALTSRPIPVVVISKEGAFRFIPKGTEYNISDVAISSSNHLIVTGKNELQIYDPEGNLDNSIPTLDKDNTPGTPLRITLDTKGRICALLTTGQPFKTQRKMIAIYHFDGTLLNMFDIGTTSRTDGSSYSTYIGCTPKDELVLFRETHTIHKDGKQDDTYNLEIADQSGRKICDPQPCSELMGTSLIHAYFGKNGQIVVNESELVGEDRTKFLTVHRYLYRNGEYKYMDSSNIDTKYLYPTGMAFTADEQELYATYSYDHLVRLFSFQEPE